MRVLFKALVKLEGVLSEVAVFLERKANMFNFADPPVTIVALAVLTLICLIASAILWIIPVRVLVFVLGLLALSPALSKAAGVELPFKRKPADAEEKPSDNLAQSDKEGSPNH